MQLSLAIKRPALGQTATLGTLYDARTDSFLPSSVLREECPTTAINTIQLHTSDVRYSKHETYAERFNLLGVDADLGASFLAGLIQAEGSGHFLRARKESELVAQKALLQDISTIHEILNLEDVGLTDILSAENLGSTTATHIVVEIHWGSRNIVVVKKCVPSLEQWNETKASLEIKLDLLQQSGRDDLTADQIDQISSASNDADMSVLGDVISNEELYAHDLVSAATCLSKVPAYISLTNDGKGKPVMYTLLPLTEVARIWKQPIPCENLFYRTSSECAEGFICFFEELSGLHQVMQDYFNLLRVHEDYVSPQHVKLVQDDKAKVRQFENETQTVYSMTLQKVRSGEVKESALWAVLQASRSEFENLGIQLPGEADYYREKVVFLNDLCAAGATYVGYNGVSLEHELAQAATDDVYIFDFSAEAKVQSSLWSKYVTQLYSLLAAPKAGLRVILCDSDAFGKTLDTLKLSFLRNGDLIMEDVANNGKRKDDRCLAKCPIQYVDRRRPIPKPISRILVNVPCPGSRCSRVERQEWQCARCECYIEYGHVDEHIYCDCGRSDFKYWTFKCISITHDSNFGAFRPERLQELLWRLESSEELNILILGRTGVGKSTFINALVNYLSHASLEAAIDAQNLEWVVPFSFSTHYANEHGEFENLNVKCGFETSSHPEADASSNIHEHDGSTGASATQSTIVHRVPIGNLLLRLIDTPGIGDTRGAQRDAENMADLLTVLQSYPSLHGILILLKPNETRLDTMFEFCVKELLANLHRDAAKNLMFGFTNTRGTNYAPGDTFGPLQKLLDDFKEVQIPFRKQNVFCFDSESFRYLAALKQSDTDLGHRDQNSASWNYSVQESTRLLNYVRELQPHRVNNTVNLFQTRQRIVDLAEPMAKIAELVQATIQVNEDEIAALATVESQGEELKQCLDMKVMQLGTTATDRPRTVCSESCCIEHSSTGVLGRDGKIVYDTIYKSFCHAPCYLKKVRLRTRGEPALRHCAAMNDLDGLCTHCGHMWTSHLHIDYDYYDFEETIRNPQTEQLLKSNSSMADKKRALINDRKILVKNMEQELVTIQDAAARFSIFLKNNSIIPYNDATLAYVERQIEDEQNKVQLAGGSRDKLENLQQFKRRYRQKIAILDEQMKRGENKDLLNQEEIRALLQELYTLEWSGKQLRTAEGVITSLSQTINREQTHVLRRKDRNRSQSLSSHRSSLGRFLSWITK